LPDYSFYEAMATKRKPENAAYLLAQQPKT